MTTSDAIESVPRPVPAGVEMTALSRLYHDTLLLPALRAGTHGRIVTVSTVAVGGLDLSDTQYDRRRFSGIGAYRASKQASRMLAWALADRLMGSPVTVNAVNPGYVVTDLTRS